MTGWAAAQEQAEVEGKYTGGRMGLAFNVGGEAPPQALADARTARRQFDSQIDGELDSILNDSQKGRLPKNNPGRQLFGGENVDVIADGEGGHAVFVTAIAAGEGDESMEGEEGEDGVIVTRQVIVTGGDPHATRAGRTPPTRRAGRAEEGRAQEGRAEVAPPRVPRNVFTAEARRSRRAARSSRS